jgi:predicted nuclease with TOPRIM domain
MYEPLQKFLKEDIKEYKDLKKQFDKQQEKYEVALVRYSNLSKLKEASALNEDAFQLYDTKKAYFKVSYDLCLRMSQLQTRIDNFIMDKVR